MGSCSMRFSVKALLLVFPVYVLISDKMVCSHFLKNEYYHELYETIDPLITHVAHHHAEDKAGLTIITTNSVDAHYISHILRKTEESISNGIYFFKEGSLTKMVQTTGNIVLLKSNDRILSDELLLEKNSLNPRSTIILFFLDNPKTTFIKTTLKNLWNRDYINVFSTFSKRDEISFITYNAYKDSFQTLKATEYNRKICNEKIIDLNQNPINVLFTFNDHTKIRKVKDYEGKNQKYEGKDYDIINTIFENLNANLSIIDIDDIIPDALDNPWFSNIDLDNKSDVQRDILRTWNITMLTKSQRTLENDGVIEVTYPHTDNAVTLLLPKRRKITKPEEVYGYLMQPLWLIHFLIFAALAIFLTIMRNSSGLAIAINSTNQLFRIMFTCSTIKFSEKTLEKLILLAWIFWCFLSSILAQAKITSMLSTDLYEKELDSLEDVYEKGKLDFIIFGLNSYIDELAEKYEGTKYMRVIDDMVKVAMDENMGEFMLLEMPKPTTFKMAVVLEHDIAKFYARHKKNRQDGWGRPLLHLMKHSIMPCFQVFHVTANSPLLPIIGTKIQQLVEGGFIGLFKQRFLFKGLIDGYLYPDEDYDIDNYELKPIDMGLAKYAFSLLFVGLSVSTISFVIEILLCGCRWVFKKLKQTSSCK